MKSHPLIDEFIPTIEGEDGICYTHPEKLPGWDILKYDKEKVLPIQIFQSTVFLIRFLLVVNIY